jgi:hypothetical protein
MERQICQPVSELNLFVDVLRGFQSQGNDGDAYYVYKQSGQSKPAAQGPMKIMMFVKPAPFFISTAATGNAP